jgi:16S rRNA C967 or C1407 C5-methylase (RsmB/RsmF family)
LKCSLKEVARLANDMLREFQEKQDREFPEINEVNLHTHFTKHVPVELQAKYKMQVEFHEARRQAQVNNAPNASIERMNEDTIELGSFRENMIHFV